MIYCATFQKTRILYPPSWLSGHVIRFDLKTEEGVLQRRKLSLTYDRLTTQGRRKHHGDPGTEARLVSLCSSYSTSRMAVWVGLLGAWTCKERNLVNLCVC